MFESRYEEDNPLGGRSAIAALPLAHNAEAHDDLLMVDLNDPVALRSIPSPYTNAPFTFAEHYKEDDVLIRDGVHPSDDRLSNRRYGHYHLGYEDKNIQFCGPRAEPGRVVNGACDVVDPSTQPRDLAPHSADAVIQLTYEPNGTHGRFNLWALTVKSGSLNVGIQYADGSIAVYNNIHAPYRWGFPGANDINRVTLEGTGEIFLVDDIQIQPIH